MLAYRSLNSTAAIASDPKQNHLLAALPDLDRRRWLSHLEFVELPLGRVRPARVLDRVELRA